LQNGSYSNVCKHHLYGHGQMYLTLWANCMVVALYNFCTIGLYGDFMYNFVCDYITTDYVEWHVQSNTCPHFHHPFQLLHNSFSTKFVIDTTIIAIMFSLCK